MTKARIYEIRGSSLCPVKSYELYRSRLNENNPSLWQTAKSKVTWDDDVWFTTVPQSKNKVGSLMANLSTLAGLSQKYTNHCVRAT